MYKLFVSCMMLMLLIVGTLIGWMSNSLLVAKASEVKTEVNSNNVFREIRIVGEDGSPCMKIVGLSVTSVEGNTLNKGLILFYDREGEVTHTLGVNKEGKFFIVNNKPDSRWGIYEPTQADKLKVKK